MAISQTVAVTRSPRNYGLSYEDLVRQRAAALPSVYAQNDAESQRKAELALRKKEYDETMAFQLEAEAARASQFGEFMGLEDERLNFERDKSQKEQDLARKKLETEAAANKQAGEIATKNREVVEKQNLYSNILGVANLGVTGYGVAKKYDLFGSKTKEKPGASTDIVGDPGIDANASTDIVGDPGIDANAPIPTGPESVMDLPAPDGYGLDNLGSNTGSTWSSDSFIDNFGSDGGYDWSFLDEFISNFGGGGDGLDDLSWLGQLF